MRQIALLQLLLVDVVIDINGLDALNPLEVLARTAALSISISDCCSRPL